jgi:sugar lactone lactonase YvrE
MRRPILLPVTLAVLALLIPSMARAQWTARHLAGPTAGGPGVTNGPSGSNRFNFPVNIASDAGGTVFVSDSGNHTIRRIATDGSVTLLAGSPGRVGSQDGVGEAARFEAPGGLAVDALGVVYVADTFNQTIRRILPDGTVSTVAGVADMPGSVDGVGAAARFRSPEGLAIDATGALFIADSGNHVIRRMAPDGTVTTVAGLAGTTGTTDGVGAAARFNGPRGVAESGGVLYVADTANSLIRTIQPNGTVATLAGAFCGFVDGPNASARFCNPTSIAVTAPGVLVVADWLNNAIRRVQAGAVTTLAGNGSRGIVDGVGAAARFRQPYGVSAQTDGSVLVADSANNTLRRVLANGTVTTVGGLAPPSGTTDGQGSAARFNSPVSVALDPAGIAYVADQLNCVIRRVDRAGNVTTFAGLAGTCGDTNGVGSAARFSNPTGVALDASGTLYVLDTGNYTLRKVLPNGTVSLFSGGPHQSAHVDGSATVARFRTPSGIAVDDAGNVYVTDGNTVRKVLPNGAVSTIAGTPGQSGTTDGQGAAARFIRPFNLAVDATGNVFVADLAAHNIRRISPTGLVTTFAGAGVAGEADGTGLSAQFYRPVGMTIDAGGVLYVTETGNHTIRSITPAGLVSTIAGLAPIAGRADGAGAAARFAYPSGLAIDRAGSRIVLAEVAHEAIREVTNPSVRSFDFESTAATALPRTGQLQTLALANGNLTLQIQRENSARFDVVNNVQNVGKPATWGARTLDPYCCSASADAFIFALSVPATSISIEFGHYGGDPADAISMRAYSGPTATGSPVAELSDTFPATPQGAPFAVRRLTLTSATPFRTVRIIGGDPAFPNSVFIDNIVVAVSGADTDGDSLPDYWESQFGLGVMTASGNDGAAGDPDGDGRTNAQEYADGTHPRGFHQRYLAEGAANGFFDLQLAILNVGTAAANIQLRYLQAGGGTVSRVQTLPALRRLTIGRSELTALNANDFATVLESDQPIVIDRTMSWGGGYGSHAETGVPAPATTWYLAEGSTTAFSLFYLLQNPNNAAATATVRYLRPGGLPPVEIVYSLPANSRTTIPVNTTSQSLASTDVSAVIVGSLPLIVERAMYKTVGGQVFAAGHGSTGVTTPSTRWFLAEGATGAYFDLFVLIVNPNASPAEVDVDYLLTSGQTFRKHYTIAPSSRFTIYVDDESIPGVTGKPLANAAVSSTVSSTNAVPIIVERTMWWPGPAVSDPFWTEAHNSAGATQAGSRWALAEGEVGGTQGAQTFILVANTSAAAGQARVTLYFEDGSSATRTYPLLPTSRSNVDVGTDFPQAAGRRFAAVVESLGATPAAIVVERAMYTSPGGQLWAAGTNALATRLQ